MNNKYQKYYKMGFKAGLKYTDSQESLSAMEKAIPMLEDLEERLDKMKKELDNIVNGTGLEHNADAYARAAISDAMGEVINLRSSMESRLRDA